MYKIDKKCIKSINKLQTLIFNIFLTQIYHSYSKTICFSFRHTFFLLNERKFSYKRYDPDPSLKLFTFDNYIFHKQKHLFFLNIALRHFFYNFFHQNLFLRESHFKEFSDLTTIYFNRTFTQIFKNVFFNAFCCDVIISAFYLKLVLIIFHSCFLTGTLSSACIVNYSKRLLRMYNTTVDLINIKVVVKVKDG